MRYLVTTKVSNIPSSYQIIMVDGTVPDWEAKPEDLHWDHHRPNGADIQIDEIPLPKQRSLLTELSNGKPPCFVTTMLDADACGAAAWVQLSHELLTPKAIAYLRAIAWDCDHLMVPDELFHLSEFAAKAVAAMKLASVGIAKELGLPNERKQWTDEHWESYYSEGFRRGTEWLIAAVKGDCPYPGQRGEADDYWQQLAADALLLQEEQRIELVETKLGAIALCYLQGIERSVDPRAFYRALEMSGSLRPETLIIRDHRQGGLQYTLGSLPTHPKSQDLDYTTGTFDRLTAAERSRNPSAGSWGGRRTVGGSPWNTASRLTVADIISLLD